MKYMATIILALICLAQPCVAVENIVGFDLGGKLETQPPDKAKNTLASNAFAQEREKWIGEGLNAARSRCELVANNLKDQWLYFDNFKIYKMGFSRGLPVESYTCTISATHMNIKNNIKSVRIEINQRTDSDRFTYQIVQNDGFPSCYEELLTECN